MSVTTLPAPPPLARNPSEPDCTVQPGALDRYFSCLAQLTAQAEPWKLADVAAVVSLVLLWAQRFYSSWATWGTLSIDSGREMYVPAMLAQGKTLYRDVWYGYTPLAPYVNAWLFRAFAIHLDVLYWAGSLTALACAILLFLIGKQLSSTLAGWTAAAILLMEAFHSWLFSFPLPYSFPTVYGCLCASLFLWCAIHACRSAGARWMVAASSVAAVALLFKLEFGAACYATLFLLVVARARQNQSWNRAAIDFAAMLPGVILCAAVAAWMVSIGGFDFITRENLASTWPSSFFMKNYGKTWLQKTGLAITAPALLHALVRTLFLAGAIWESWLLFWRKKYTLGALALRASLMAALAAYAVFALKREWLEVLSALFFPQDMVFYLGVVAAFAFWRIARRSENDPSLLLPVAITLALAVLVAFRILLQAMPLGYPIYYSGPAVLAFLIVLRPIVPRVGKSPRDVIRGELLPCLACLAVAAVYSARYSADLSERATVATERGTAIVARQTANNYRAALALMKRESAEGRPVLVVPEDTSLYFLSGTEAPSRLFFFAPGMLVPGQMTDHILHELAQKPIRYVLWSSRTFEEYGVTRFGYDFDRPLGNYLTSHYRRVGLLVPDSDIEWQTRFALWERKND